MDSHSRIEHFIPLSTDKEKAIDYGNMLGICDGSEKVMGQQAYYILFCDAHKRETVISTSPLNKLQMDEIGFPNRQCPSGNRDFHIVKETTPKPTLTITIKRLSHGFEISLREPLCIYRSTRI